VVEVLGQGVVRPHASREDTEISVLRRVGDAVEDPVVRGTECGAVRGRGNNRAGEDDGDEEEAESRPDLGKGT
jgi:hypothetical protein